MKNKLIVFDIDDTLYNEIDYVKSGYKKVSEYIENKYNQKNIYDELINLFNKSSKLVFNRLLDKLSINYTDCDIKYLVDLYQNHKPNIVLSQEVINTLNELKKEYKLAIVSDGNYNTQYLKCQALKLDKYFDEIILTSKYGKDYYKPSRKSFDLLSSKYGIDLSEMYYVADNPNKDFYISKYGIKTVRYYNKLGIYYNDEYLDNIQEDYSINYIGQIKEILQSVKK